MRMSTNQEAYRPRELIITTVEVHNGKCLVDNNAQSKVGLDVIDEIQIENLIVEVKGIENLDTQWAITQNPSPGEKLRQGKTCI